MEKTLSAIGNSLGLIIERPILDLLNIPIGTAIGAYSLWVLLNDETSKLFLVKTA